MTGWWKSNRVALLGIAVLLPVTLGAIYANEWGRYNAINPTSPIDVTARETVDFGGANWTLEGSRSITSVTEEGREAGLPVDTVLHVVTFEVDPYEFTIDEFTSERRSAYCQLQLVEADGAQRTWSTATFSPISYTRSDGVEGSCWSENTEQYTVEAIFVVPRDASDNLVMTLDPGTERPNYLRFTL